MVGEPYWTNLETCWWLLARDGGCHALSAELAARFSVEEGFAVMLGDYPTCKAVALARVRPEEPAAEKPKRPRKPRTKKQPAAAAIPATLFETAAA